MSDQKTETQFDAIVIGSGITGGWAAKELTERGLKVAMIERGRKIEHQVDYTTESIPPWQLPFRGYGDQELYRREYPIQMQGRGFDEWTQGNFVNDKDHPYQSTADKPAQWRRGYQLGGRSLTWGRQTYRWGPQDFAANAQDGHGVAWPVGYDDLHPWYDHVESFIGVNGTTEGMPQLPDGIFQPAMKLNVCEAAFQRAINSHYSDRRMIPGRAAHLTEPKEGRVVCQNRNICGRGCSFGAYFSTQSSTLPAAMKTGRLTVMTNHVVESIVHDPATRRATGVRVIDTVTKGRHIVTARLVFVCAGSFNSVATLLRSTSEQYPHGLANSSGALGQYIMDHASTMSAIAEIPGFDQHTYFGNRPVNFVIPRFRNIGAYKSDFLRGYSFQGAIVRAGWGRGGHQAGIGKAFKASLRGPGPWTLVLVAFAECLPNRNNRITLESNKFDVDGLPQLNITLLHGDNERKLLADAQHEAHDMIALMNGKILVSSNEPGAGGTSVHEMGGARMGSDPSVSVVNAFNQTHDVPNVFVTDGAAMASTGNVNPSLTYMAFTARAAANAVSMLQEGKL